MIFRCNDDGSRWGEVKVKTKGKLYIHMSSNSIHYVILIVSPTFDVTKLTMKMHYTVKYYHQEWRGTVVSS